MPNFVPKNKTKNAIMKHTFNLDKTSIRLIVSHKGKKYRKATGLTISPSLWNPKAKSLSSQCKDVRVLKELRQIHLRLLEREPDAVSERDVLSVIEFGLTGNMRTYLGNTPAPTFSEYLPTWVSLGGTSTAQRRLFMHNVERFMGKDIGWNDVDESFFFRFVNEMDAREYAKNYKRREVGQLKTVMEEGRKLKYHNNLLYKDWHIEREVPVSVYLTKSEVDAIWNLDLSVPIQRKARDLFIIGIYTVARFSDYSRVCDDIIHDGYIRFVHKKTSTPVLVPVAPRVREVLDRYGGKAPRISQAAFNTTIKEVCRLAGIDSIVEITKSRGRRHITERLPKWQLVHSHTARKTGATLLRLSGASMREIMLIGGWSNEQTLELYLRMTKEENAKLMRENPFFK